MWNSPHPCPQQVTPIIYTHTRFVAYWAHTGLNDDAATGSQDAGNSAGGLACMSEFAIAMRDKILEFAGASAEDGMLPLVAVGAAAALLAAFTLYLLTLYFDREPFLFNGGKMGKLEAQSIYTANKKQC